MGVAIGQMGLSREEYLDLTPSEFKAIHRRWKEKVEADRDAELYQKLYVARLQLFRQLCPPKAKTIRITDLWELPDEAAERIKRTEEAIQRKEEDRQRMLRNFNK